MAPFAQRFPCSFEAACDYNLNDLEFLDSNDWKKVRTLGEALFGKVYLVKASPALQKQFPGVPEVFALKQMPCDAVLTGRRGLESARNELCAARELRSLTAACVAQVYFVAHGPGKGRDVENKPCFFLATEYCEMGELFAHIRRLGSIACDEALREVMCQLLTALKTLHEAGIAHRDVSLENLLITAKNDQAQVKLIDFGQAIRVHAPGDTDNEAPVPHTCLGLPGKAQYRAPEVNVGVGLYKAKSADVFACGVLLFTLAVGVYPSMDKLFPYDCKSANASSRRCTTLAPYLQSLNVKERIRPTMLDFLEELLSPNPESRITAAEALEHPWLKGTIENVEALMMEIDEDLSSGSPPVQQTASSSFSGLN